MCSRKSAPAQVDKDVNGCNKLAVSPCCTNQTPHMGQSNDVAACTHSTASKATSQLTVHHARCLVKVVHAVSDLTQAEQQPQLQAAEITYRRQRGSTGRQRMDPTRCRGFNPPQGQPVKDSCEGDVASL